LLDEEFKTKIAQGQLAPVVEKLSGLEIDNFIKRHKDIIDRAKMLDEIRNKIEKEIREKEEELRQESKKKLKGCLF